MDDYAEVRTAIVRLMTWELSGPAYKAPEVEREQAALLDLALSTEGDQEERETKLNDAVMALLTALETALAQTWLNSSGVFSVRVPPRPGDLLR